MSISFIVTGHFANGSKRYAGLRWQGGPTKTQNPKGATYLPAFQQRAERYGKAFETELEGAPKREDGLPRFEYIVISYKISAGKSHSGCIYLALTPNRLTKLTKNIGKPINLDDPRIRYSFLRDGGCAVVDMTKFKNADEFWLKVRIYANDIYCPLFSA